MGEPPLRLNPVAWLSIAFPFAYLYAGVPALITGYVAAVARYLAPAPVMGDFAFRLAVPVGVGAAASILFSLVTLASEVAVEPAIVGALSAFVCTLLVEWRSRDLRAAHMAHDRHT